MSIKKHTPNKLFFKKVSYLQDLFFGKNIKKTIPDKFTYENAEKTKRIIDEYQKLLRIANIDTEEAIVNIGGQSEKEVHLFQNRVLEEHMADNVVRRANKQQTFE